MHFSAEVFETFQHWCQSIVSNGHFSTNAKIWDTSAPNTWCQNVLGPKCLYTCHSSQLAPKPTSNPTLTLTLT